MRTSEQEKLRRSLDLRQVSQHQRAHVPTAGAHAFRVLSANAPRNMDLQLPDGGSTSRRSSYGSDTDSRMPSGKRPFVLDVQNGIGFSMFANVVEVSFPGTLFTDEKNERKRLSL